jgi:hypothetical protein
LGAAAAPWCVPPPQYALPLPPGARSTRPLASVREWSPRRRSGASRRPISTRAVSSPARGTRAGGEADVRWRAALCVETAVEDGVGRAAPSAGDPAGTVHHVSCDRPGQEKHLATPAPASRAILRLRSGRRALPFVARATIRIWEERYLLFLCSGDSSTALPKEKGLSLPSIPSSRRNLPSRRNLR